MQLKYYLLVLLFATACAASAQDVIHLMDSTTINASVKSITPRTITYKRTDNPEGPDYVLGIKKVHHITFIQGNEASYADLHPAHHPHNPIQAHRMHAQHKRQESPMNERFQIKITPSSLLDTWGGMVPVAVEYDFGKHFGIEAMAAIPLYYYGMGYQFTKWQDVTVKKDAKFSISLINYLHSWKEGHLYLALEGLYRHEILGVRHGQIDLGTQGDYDLYEYFLSANVNKTYYGGGIKFGITTRLAGNLWFESYIGLGMLSGATWHQNMQGVTNGSGGKAAGFLGSDIGSGRGKIDYIEGKGGALYIPFALRLSYHFNHPKKQ
jgi:hypothetical protein